MKMPYTRSLEAVELAMRTRAIVWKPAIARKPAIMVLLFLMVSAALRPIEENDDGARFSCSLASDRTCGLGIFERGPGLGLLLRPQPWVSGIERSVG